MIERILTYPACCIHQGITRTSIVYESDQVAKWAALHDLSYHGSVVCKEESSGIRNNCFFVFRKRTIKINVKHQRKSHSANINVHECL